MSSFNHKRAKIGGLSSLTLLPASSWEYLDWLKEAHKVVNQVPGGRSSPGMQALLTVVEQFIAEFFGRREFHLAPAVVEYTTYRFREELEAILATNALRD
jgi:hypothetical protein